jgi:hypothetical protein
MTRAQPGICFGSECSEAIQKAVVRDVHDFILSTHNPRVIATIQQHGGCPSRTFTSMDYGFAPYLPDTVLDLQPFSSFAHYQEAQSRPARVVMRQRQRDFSESKCCMQQWLWDDMDSDMRLRIAYMCLCVAELHAVSGSPDLFQMTPELIQVMSSLPNLQPTLGFKSSSRTSTARKVDTAQDSDKFQAAAAPVSSTAAITSSSAVIATDTTSAVAFTSNKQRKKAMQQVAALSRYLPTQIYIFSSTVLQAKMEAWARAHADNKDAANILARMHKPHVEPQPPAPPTSTLLPTLSTYEGRCSAQSPCKWIVARRDGSEGTGCRGDLVGAMLLVYSGDTAFGLFTGLDYEGSKECRA